MWVTIGLAASPCLTALLNASPMGESHLMPCRRLILQHPRRASRLSECHYCLHPRRSRCAFHFSHLGLLGIAADDSSSDDDDDQDGDKGGEKDAAASLTPTPATATAAIPEGLPPGFFDDPEDGGTSENAVESKEQAAPAAAPASAAPVPAAGGFGAERAAELAAEAAAIAEADALREAEKLAALRAAGISVPDGVPAMASAVATAGGGEAGAGAAAEEDAAAAAPNGSALPEGFFDDPEIDAKSRGVDLKAKKKEDEQ